MLKQKKSNNDLLYIINLLSKKREEFISSFLYKDYELIGLTFKYEFNQAAFDLVRERFITLWIDKHIIQIMNDNIPVHVKKKAIALISSFMNTSSSKLDDTEIKHFLLKKKLDILHEMLKYEDLNTQKINKLKFSYDKDKALFEREFIKYEKLFNSVKK